MKELQLVHTIRTPKGENMGSIRDVGGNSWERQANGDYLLVLKGDPENEYLIPAHNVKFERRTRTPGQAPKK